MTGGVDHPGKNAPATAPAHMHSTPRAGAPSVPIS
jgi:hypothetical protein